MKIKKKKRPPAGFEQAKLVLLVYNRLRGDWIHFLPSCGFVGIGVRSEPHSSQLLSLQPRSSVHRQALTALLLLAYTFSPPVVLSLRCTN